MSAVTLLQLSDKELILFIVLAKGLMTRAFVLASLFQDTLGRGAGAREGGIELGESEGVLEHARLTMEARLSW